MNPVAMIKRALSADRELTSEELDRAAVRASEAAQAAETRIQELEVERHRILVQGTEADLEAHDELTARARREQEQNEARAVELRKLSAQALAEERIRSAPERIVALREALDTHREAEAAYHRAQQALQEAHQTLDHVFTFTDADRVHEIERPPDDLVGGVERALGITWDVRKGRKQLDPDEPVVFRDVRAGTIELRGRWTDEERRKVGRHVELP